MATKPTFAHIAAKAIHSRPVAKPPTPQIQIIAKPTGDSSAEEAVALKTPTDDTSTHVSSSESSVKLPSFDKQSVASGTTFAMDEKESLRPDDSASLRAIEDEDGPSTGPAGSRVGSDTDARAFSAQLHAIGQIGPVPPRAILQPAQRPQIQWGSLPMNGAAEAANVEADDQPNPVSVAPDMPLVDEKLLEGLASVRDRVFILKIEQDILDFMKNDKETHLTLPDCNSFYRMLSHRLAEYYGLGHDHYPRDSGTAVQITKLPTSKIPPPLAGIPVPNTQCESPPPPMGPRKVLRRGEIGEGMSGPSTTANSRGPSKAASEAGDGTSDGKTKDRRNMTREEREEAYRIARLRILGSKEPAPEEEKGEDENHVSRSSSASGKKNKVKKPKVDDDFVPRGSVPFVAPGNDLYGQYPTQQYGGDGSFYWPGQHGATTVPQDYTTMSSSASPPNGAYASGYGGPAGQHFIPYPQYLGQNTTAPFGQAYAQQPMSANDMALQMAAMALNNVHQKQQGTSPGYTPQIQTAQPSWNTYGTPQQMYPQPQMYGQGQYQGASATPGQPQPYLYGQLPNPNLKGQGAKMQHPLPGSFNRQQFNPHSQAFVPGGTSSGSPMPQMPLHSTAYYSNQYTYSPNNPPSQQYRPNTGPPSQHRPHPPKTNTGSFPSPAAQQPMQIYSGATPTMSSQQMVAPNSASHIYGQASAESTQPPRPMPGLGASTQQLAHPLPQPPNPESSIAKWGTPAHLPPKPPTPTNPRPTKYIDLNKGRNTVPGLPRNYSATGTGPTGN